MVCLKLWSSRGGYPIFPSISLRYRGFVNVQRGFLQNPLCSWETGSYDIALEDAGIQDFNVVPYTSVIPPEGKEIPFEEARPRFHHGAVLETIMAEMNGSQGDRISAGVGRCKIRRKRDGKMIGGYAAEYKGHAQEHTVKEILREDLKGIFDRRFDVNEYEMMEESYSIRVGEVTKSYGTVIACICFLSCIMPILQVPEGMQEMMKHHEHNVADTAKEEGGSTRRIKFF